MPEAATPRSDAATPLLVHVDLAAVAANLNRRDPDDEWDELRVARWLCHTQWVWEDVMGKPGEQRQVANPSPFAQADDWGWFYTEEDPSHWLEPEEILETQPSPRRRHRIGDGSNVNPDWKRWKHVSQQPSRRRRRS
jgi:hypothetical protein